VHIGTLTTETTLAWTKPDGEVLRQAAVRGAGEAYRSIA
jgi:hypothetical protein